MWRNCLLLVLVPLFDLFHLRGLGKPLQVADPAWRVARLLQALFVLLALPGPSRTYRFRVPHYWLLVMQFLIQVGSSG